MNSVKLNVIDVQMERATYHHGDLRQALLNAAEAVLAEHGTTGFSLRECARRAGVSPAAPAHHFGNVTGLLTAIAARGHVTLAAAMQAASDAAAPAGAGRLEAIGAAYVDVALRFPERFRVMFGATLLDRHDAALCQAGDASFAILTREVAALSDGMPPSTAAVTLAWSAVHGYATLVLNGRLPLPDPAADPRPGAAALLGLLGAALLARPATSAPPAAGS